MKKIYLLIIFTIILTGCQKEEILQIEPQNLSSGTVSQKEALDLLFKHSSTRTSSKAADQPYATPNLELMHYEDLVNSQDKILVIPAQIKNNSGESKILMMKFDGVVKARILTLYADNSGPTDFFSGKVSLKSMDGEFLIGYRVYNGIFMSKFIFGNKKNTNKSSDCDESYSNQSDDFCNSELDEVMLDVKISYPTPYVSISTIYETSSGTGNTGDFDDAYYDYCGGGCGHSTTTPTEEEDKINNNLTDPCARTLFNQLLSGIFADDPLKPEIHLLNETLNFNEAILALFSESTKFHYTIENGDLANPKASGHTIGSTITLNNLYLSNATELSIARTIIHETLHTYLNFKYQNPLDLNNMSFRQKMDLFASEYGFNPNGDERDKNRFHHEFMGQYVDAMAYSLYEWDKSYGTGGNLGWDYYYKMAAAGLSYEDSDGNGQFTDSFYALFTENEDIQEVIDITNNEKEGNDKAKGTKC